MCEANAYLVKEGGEEELVFENVDRVLPREDGILMEDIFGKKKILRARIKEMALVEHKIFLEAF
ncbi:MAG: CooT family nickel-binding protein [Moorella sp. (in: Bacteria)]|nr:CooT family nickel-binding protein [Moorella sp. (in: firmicutes)]